MAYLLGIDTGGTYTDAVVLDDVANTVVAKAKSLTTRPNLSIGVGRAIDAALADSTVSPSEIAMVSLSTTLATNALVEGRGGRVGLVFIGFDKAELSRADLADALGDDPVILVDGGHSHSGGEAYPLDLEQLSAKLGTFSGITGIAVAGKFATRNPDHEIRIRNFLRSRLSVPVTCSHELSQALGGPKRALTAVLNARLIGLIDRLIAATQSYLQKVGITARLMVVRGDGALIPSDLARERPIETILSGPAASIAGAQWLTGERDALVSDIGGTTTDICILQNGMPQIDPNGAKVGRYRTMVEAVAMRTFGLGGDSEVTLNTGLDGGLTLGPRRVMPISLLADTYPDVVHGALDGMLGLEATPKEATRFALALWAEPPSDLDRREAAVAARLQSGPLPWAKVVTSRVEMPALARLVQRGLVMIADVTPSDADLILGTSSRWDRRVAEKALSLMAKRRTGAGNRLAENSQDLAKMIIEQLTRQTIHALLETSFAAEGWDDPATLAQHPLVSAGLLDHKSIVGLSAGLALPVIGLGASAQNYYRVVGNRLKCKTILPEDGDVANAIGAVVGQVAIHAEGTITNGGDGGYRIHHLPDGPQNFNDRGAAIRALRKALTQTATDKAQAAGVEDIQINESLDLQEAQIEARVMLIEATMRITARGRPRITS